MAEKKRGEKEEKQEKGGEKEEKYSKDPISAIFIGIVVVVIGIVLFFTSNEMYGMSWENAWAYILTGVGGAFLLRALLHSTIPQYRRPIYGETLVGLILLTLGLSQLYGLENWWPVALIIVGVLAIIYGLVKLKKREKYQ